MLQESISLCIDHPETFVSLGVLYARMGKRDKTGEIVENLKQTFSAEKTNPITAALLIHELNDTEKVTAYLQGAVRIRDTNLLFSLEFPLYDSLKKTQSRKEVIGPLNSGIPTII